MRDNENAFVGDLIEPDFLCVFFLCVDFPILNPISTLGYPMGLAFAFLFPHHDMPPPGVQDNTKLREKLVQVLFFLFIRLFISFFFLIVDVLHLSCLFLINLTRLVLEAERQSRHD
jgi:hypothetical protein